MQIEVIDTGYFYADGGAMFGAIPKSAWQRRYNCDENNCCVLAIRSLLVRTDTGRIVLIDTGVSEKSLQQYNWYRFFDVKSLYQELEKRGISRIDVTDVILTHLHFDHCGNLDFPDATYWISGKQWENLSHPHPLEASSLDKQALSFLEDKATLQLVDRDICIEENLNLRLFEGHTSGQLVPYIKSSSREFVYAGDVIPLVAHLSLDWISAYDLAPTLSYESKKILLENVVKEDKALIYCHDAYTICSSVKEVRDYFRLKEKVGLPFG